MEEKENLFELGLKRKLIYFLSPDVLFLSLVCFLAPFFIFPKISLTWFFLVVPLIFFWKWRQERHLLPRTLLDWALALLLIQMFINCFVVLDLSFSLYPIPKFKMQHFIVM